MLQTCVRAFYRIHQIDLVANGTFVAMAEKSDLVLRHPSPQLRHCSTPNGIKSLLEVWHVVCTAILPTPFHHTVPIYTEIASRLPTIAAFSGSDINAILFPQLRDARNTPKNMPEARRAQTPRSVSFAFCINNDFQVGRIILGRVRERRKPSVCRLAVAVGYGYEVDIRIGWCHCAQVKKCFFGNCDVITIMQTCKIEQQY